MPDHTSIVCSFCGKNKQDTNILIAGKSAHICNACIEQAHEIVKQDLDSEPSISEDIVLLKPKL